MVGRIDPHGRRHEGEVVAAWPAACGEEIAAHTLCHSFKEGELLVFVDTPTWANELSLMAEELRGRLDGVVPDAGVREIRFVVSKRVADAARAADEERLTTAGPDADVVPAPLSDEELAEIERASKGIADADLRAAAEALMRRDMELKKGRERTP
jgi:hypothetical protein